MVLPSKQRWLHYYFVNELFHTAAGAYICFYTPAALIFTSLDYVVPGLARVVACVLGYLCFSLAMFLIVIPVLILRRTCRHRNLPGGGASIQHAVPRFRSFFHTARDGIKLHVRVSLDKRRQKVAVADKKVMLLAAPLGQRGPSLYNPIMARYGPEYTYITWDYRGFFRSDTPDRRRRISIHEHAEDAMEVIRACGFEKVSVMVGHSMGTAVAFETVLLFPDAVGALVILNGFHGHVFSTAFQPLVRFPFVGDLLSAFVEYLLRHTDSLAALQPWMRTCLAIVMPLYTRIFGSRLMRELEGDDYLMKFYDGYFGPLVESPQSLRDWLRLFQELDAHSVYHLLPDIKHPVLIISGYCDFVTPPMQSVEIGRRIPHAVHYCDPFSSHASLLENPERCMVEIETFLSTLTNNSTLAENTDDSVKKNQ